MVFKYKRKSTRAEGWTEEIMASALKAIENKTSTIRSAAKQFNIPYPTLRKHYIKQSSVKRLGSFRPIFSGEMELQLVNHIRDLDSRFYGLTRDDLCELAFELATRNNLPNNFKNGRAGDQWYYNFMQRHPELSLRRPESTSISRACGFNRPQVQIFFDNLKLVRERYNIVLDNIYNVDETGIQTSSKRPPKVISVKGKKQVGAIASAERGQLVTAICCCSASGKFIPPCLIFPRKKRNPRYLQNTPPGTVDFVSDNGWVNSDIFLEWLKFFVRSVRPTVEQKCLLIVDNHVSHRSLAVLDYASANNVVLLSVPPHCTHRLQPLDVSVYGPLSTYFERAIDKWQKQHPAQRVTLFEIGEIFGSAYLQSATPHNAISGFKKSGIFDGDINVFSDVDFSPADVTNVNECNSVTTTSPEETITQSAEITLEQTISTDTVEKLEALERTPPPSTSRFKNSENLGGSSIRESRASSSPAQYDDQLREEPGPSVSVQKIKKLPKATPKTTSRKRKAQKSEILTSTPFKDSLRHQQAPKRPNKVIKRKELDKLMPKFPTPPVPLPSDPTEADNLCLICGDTFGHSKPGEQWIQCNMCEQWAHQLCTEYLQGIFICDFCKKDVLRSH